uniref:Large subunit GTPase 1 homolog n=1 Tax=Acrobeloides nanus TaxID=290746 RepID=A0A914CFL0_9BILA
MTKRRIKNQKPTGFNQSLGNSLVNKEKERYTRQPHKASSTNQPPEKVLDSVTHETTVEEFLKNAELAGETFEAEKGNARLITSAESTIVKIEDLQSQSFEELYEKYGSLLSIPRRPPVDLFDTKEELEEIENRMFLEWRRNLASLQEGQDVVLTPFERNLELWRQLWRVIERSDIIVQIVDARNPLMFRSIDLEKYVKEVDESKMNVLLINKADLLSTAQIEEWRTYFEANKINAIFWSAMDSSMLEESAHSTDIKHEEENIRSLSLSETKNVAFVQQPEDLIARFKELWHNIKKDAESLVVGMVGYPNVGKSSTINRILGAKKVSVSATPGKTKHFQTLIVDNELTLCDCPGLVMPSFGFNPSEMVLNGILSVNHIRDYYSPTQLMCNRIPRRYLESLYSILLPRPAEHEDPNRPPTAHELLTTVAFLKGFMSSSGIPDCSRAGRLLLKDVVNGKVKWARSPPGVEQHNFDNYPISTVSKDTKGAESTLLKQLERRNLLDNQNVHGKSVDNNFFQIGTVGAHVKSAVNPISGTVPDSKKHFKRGKKEKLRRIYNEYDA